MLPLPATSQSSEGPDPSFCGAPSLLLLAGLPVMFSWKPRAGHEGGSSVTGVGESAHLCPTANQGWPGFLAPVGILQQPVEPMGHAGMHPIC